MYISYFDESGDDGFPQYSSPIFVLSALYLHHLNWKDIFNTIYNFRKQLKKDFNIPINVEMHTKYFLLNKKPYRDMDLKDEDRILVIDLLCDLISQLDWKIINVVINKTKISIDNYQILDRALTYSVQRIENDLQKSDPTKKFMVITDEGRVGKMRSTTRKIQRINFIPSKFTPSSYRQEIKSLIEDPLPKSSKESYFIQTSDTVAFIVYLYSIFKLKVGKPHNRLPKEINRKKINNWMDRLKESLNTEASGDDEYGVVCYPK